MLGGNKCYYNPYNPPIKNEYKDEGKQSNNNSDAKPKKIAQKSRDEISLLDHFLRGTVKVFKGAKQRLMNFFSGDDISIVIPQENKVILMLGETGAGKSSTLNTFKNFLEHVKYKDEFKWELVDEDHLKHKKKTESLTEYINIYNSNKYTFIDTPGFNDTRGKKQDNKTIGDIKKLLDSKLDYIDAICFVVKFGDNRDTEAMKYVIDNVLSLFAKDVENNIFIIVTHYDLSGKVSPPIVEEHNILQNCDEIFINNFVYFDKTKREAKKQARKAKKKKKNSKKKTRRPDDDDDDVDFERMFNKTNRELQFFFNSITESERVSINLTSKALAQKKAIQAHIDNLTTNISATLKQRAILLKFEKTGIMPGKIKWKVKPTVIDHPNWCLNNTKDKRTCHKNCSAWWLGQCFVFKAGICRICGKPKASHKQERRYWGLDIKFDYSEHVEVSSPNHLKEETDRLEIKLFGGFGSIVKFIKELNNIALQPINCTIETYINDLHTKEHATTRDPEILQFLSDLKNPNVISAINQHIKSLEQKGIQFSDLNHNDLQKQLKTMSDVVIQAFKLNKLAVALPK